jgi:hypothetical protein
MASNRNRRSKNATWSQALDARSYTAGTIWVSAVLRTARVNSIDRALNGYYTFGLFDIRRVDMYRELMTLLHHSFRFSCLLILVRF